MSIDLLSHYQQEVAQGAISHDARQFSVLEALQHLADTLISLKQQGRSLLDRLRRHTNLGAGTVQGLYLYGGVGRGKSMLMDMFYEALPVQRKRRVHFHAFMLEIHERLHHYKQEHPDAEDALETIAHEIAKTSWLLCFDELHVTDIADAMILGRLFGFLFAKGVVVVATSNRHPDDLYKHGLQRERFLPFIALFKEKMRVMALESDTDYRLRHMHNLATVYFTPLGKEADQFMEHSFATLTRHNPVKPVALALQGRTLTIEKAAGDTAWLSFEELCARPLGAADYLALAREFTTLLLSDIPLLSPENRNEAKRFVTLIDALYEHKTKLICSAAAAPDALYPSGDGAFEFERTVSRLIEMQSDLYVSGEHHG